MLMELPCTTSRVSELSQLPRTASYPFPENLDRLYDFTEPVIADQCPKNGAVLDIGCGNGSIAKLLLDAGASRVVAFDKDPDIIALASRLHPGPTYLVGDAEDPRFLYTLGRFDFVLLRNVFHHFLYKDRFLQTARTLITRSGTLLIIDLDYESNFCHFAVLATHVRFLFTHQPIDSLRLLWTTRLFLGRAMRVHRREDTRLLRQQRWYLARDVENRFREFLVGSSYCRFGQVLGLGGVYMVKWMCS